MKGLSASLASFAAVAACATPRPAALPGVPEELRVDPALVLLLEARATGVQIYVCGPGKEDPASSQWVFQAPEADLFDATGARIGRHYAGPTWESVDGSKVVGRLKAQASAPESTAVPWLLLVAKATSGPGLLSRVEAVQRVDTVGGKAPPASSCDPAHAGTQARIPYQATYRFYGAAR